MKIFDSRQFRAVLRRVMDDGRAVATKKLLKMILG